MSLPTLAIAVVALLHTAFFVLESMMWTSPTGRRVFGTSQEEAEATRVLALNQGFYNLGAATLLMWFHTDNNTAGVLGMLLFLAGMGLIGAVTANWRIFFFQTLPALAAFGVLYGG